MLQDNIAFELFAMSALGGGLAHLVFNLCFGAQSGRPEPSLINVYFGLF
jgi:hypothetical protein